MSYPPRNSERSSRVVDSGRLDHRAVATVKWSERMCNWATSEQNGPTARSPAISATPVQVLCAALFMMSH